MHQLGIMNPDSNPGSETEMAAMAWAHCSSWASTQDTTQQAHKQHQATHHKHAQQNKLGEKHPKMACPGIKPLTFIKQGHT